MFFKNRPEVSYTPRAILPPVSGTGIKVMSINLLLENEEQAVVWRGPLVGRAVKQFWTDTLWDTLDFLIVDFPPGTSDAPLTVMQSLPMSGILPGNLPSRPGRDGSAKGRQYGQSNWHFYFRYYRKHELFRAPDTGKEYEIFGTSHAEETAKMLNIPVLARLPVDSSIAVRCDQGKVEECQIPEFNAVVDWIEKNTPDCQLARM